jgi:hypothetical protein|tara:strand:+ start:2684 stop:2827 length:144 start_codon:yes stop_codon:yes gene_type:complete
MSKTKGIMVDIDLLKEFNIKYEKAETIEDKLKLEKEYLKQIYKYGSI